MNWKNDATASMLAYTKNSHLKPVIDAVAEQDGKIDRDELESQVGADAVRELLDCNVITTNRNGGRQWIIAQATRETWRKP